MVHCFLLRIPLQQSFSMQFRNVSWRIANVVDVLLGFESPEEMKTSSSVNCYTAQNGELVKYLRVGYHSLTYNVISIFELDAVQHIKR